jgi:hypothetical protein
MLEVPPLVEPPKTGARGVTCLLRFPELRRHQLAQRSSTLTGTIGSLLIGVVAFAVFAWLAVASVAASGPIVPVVVGIVIAVSIVAYRLFHKVQKTGGRR